MAEKLCKLRKYGGVAADALDGYIAVIQPHIGNVAIGNGSVSVAAGSGSYNMSAIAFTESASTLTIGSGGCYCKLYADGTISNIIGFPQSGTVDVSDCVAVLFYGTNATSSSGFTMTLT